jgi:acyl dehydratase
MKFSEFREGQVLEFGNYLMSEAEIIDFARRYDPQPFHVDPAAAQVSNWNGIIASGFHTCSVAMRLIVDNVLAGSESSGSPGLSSISWLKPVRPGDLLSMRVEVLQVKLSQSRGTGVVFWKWQLSNQRPEVVLDLVATSLFDLQKLHS